MEYPKEFESLINETKNNYVGEFIGVGNPASNILIVGKEPAIPKEKKEQRLQEIVNNYKQWEVNLRNDIGIDKVLSMDERSYEYNPLYPYKGQKFLWYIEKIVDGKIIPIRGEGGTSKTWYQYQKLWDLIRDGKKKNHSDFIDFHVHCFSTELSSANEKYSSQVTPEKRKNSINIRKRLLCHPFYQRFSIVILAVGHYPKQHDIDIESIFKTKWDGQTCEVGRFWYNIHNSLTGTPRLLIHTNQLSMVSDELIKELADRCIEFKSKYHINL